MTDRISRAEFMKYTGTTVIGAYAGALLLGGCSAVSTAPLAPEGSYHRDGNLVIISLPAVDELRAVGGAVRLEVGNGSGHKILVVHAAEETYLAYANRCTHNGKELDYRHEQNRVQCISGKSHFSLDGEVTKGPAGSGLVVYPTHREVDDLVIEVS
ncbi:MAG: Rieske (2Fe-2S) protein [Fidelibacterota bacterium]|nr:MAG: Rieske (2Fe-2S) protein [Candidatus Neomarinimicrobiota bacterium]